MMRPVVQNVTALTEAAQIAQPVVGGVVVEMGGGEHDAGGAQADSVHQVGPACGAAAPIPPRFSIHIEPAPIWQTAKFCQVRPAAVLAAALGTLEANLAAEFGPVRRVEASKLGVR